MKKKQGQIRKVKKMKNLGLRMNVAKKWIKKKRFPKKKKTPRQMRKCQRRKRG